MKKWTRMFTIPTSPPEKITVVDNDQMMGDILTTLQQLQCVHWAAPRSNSLCTELLEEELRLIGHVIKIIDAMNDADIAAYESLKKATAIPFSHTQ